MLPSKYISFNLAVRNVERQIMSSFVKGVQMFQPKYYQSWLQLLTSDVMNILRNCVTQISLSVMCLCFTLQQA